MSKCLILDGWKLLNLGGSPSKTKTQYSPFHIAPSPSKVFHSQARPLLSEKKYFPPSSCGWRMPWPST